jgi:hypothetical protein
MPLPAGGLIVAKQNVSYVERHLEKIVIGVAGAVLLFVLVVNTVMSPHATSVKGESVGPTGLYATLAEQADASRRRMNGAAAGAGGDGEIKIDDIIKPVVKDSGPDNELLAPGVPPNPPLPQLKGHDQQITPRSRIQLAEVLPPTQPKLSTGKAFARLDEPRLKQIGVPGDLSGQAVLGTSADLHWVTGVAAISRRDQRAKFVDENYLPDRAELIVAELRVERREQLPNGCWADPQVVAPYMAERVIGKPMVRLVPDGNSYALTPDDERYIGEYRTALASRETQVAILRQVFQKFLIDQSSTRTQEDDRYEWKVPKSLTSRDGTEIDLTSEEYGIQFEPDEKVRPGAGGAYSGTGTGVRAGAGTGYRAGTGTGYRAGTGARGPAGGVRPGGEGLTAPPTGGSVNPWAKEMITKAKAAIEKKNWLEAQQLLQAVSDNKEVLANIKNEAERLLRDNIVNIELAEQARAGGQAGTGEGEAVLGPDIEPVWFTDLSVEPGKTYQYRASIIALNQYVGMASRLKDPQDAGKLLVQGEWSPWSEVVTVPPAKYLIFSNIAKNGRALVDLWAWANGRWEKAPASELGFGVGDVIAFNRAGRPPLSYDAVVVSIDRDRPFESRIAGPRDENFKYEGKQPTGALVLVNSRGQTEERFIAEDAQLRSEVSKLVAEDRKKHAAAREPAGSVSPTPKPIRPAPKAGDRSAPPPPREREGGGRKRM